jgi:hypothetical protein
VGVNDYNISSGPEPVHGTGWNQDLAGQGKHGKRSFNKDRAAARIARSQARPQPMVAIQSPLQVDGAAPAFVEEFRANERGTGFLSSKIVRAVRGR